MKDFISVDWDFFIYHGMFDDISMPDGSTMPGALVYDWQMGEQRPAVMQEVLWNSRATGFRRWGMDIQERTPLLVNPLEFYDEVGYLTPAWMGDSHATAALLARDYGGGFRCWNFDAHHDLGYNGQQYEEGDNWYCDNWVQAALQHGWISEYVLVYPDWLGMKEWNPDHAAPNVRVMTYSDFQNEKPELSPELAYLCRSSAWTPPWWDEEFQSFADLWGADCLDCNFLKQGFQHTPYNACEVRPWNWDDVEENVRIWDQVQREVDKLA